MQQFLLWLLAAVPVVIMPGLSFYFDVIPRLVLLLMVVSAIILTRATIFSDSTLGRWFCAAAGVYILSLIVSSLLSANPALSLSGSTWRRFGLITQVALTLLAVVLAADLASRRGNILLLMRAFSTFGFAAAIYGIFQYFGKDPFLDSSQYHVGEGVWTIVRPPGTAGHADYFAVYLLMVAFCAWALVLSESRRGWRRFGALTVPFAAMALILTGTRGALVGARAAGTPGLPP